jgi:hypothetical protein
MGKHEGKKEIGDCDLPVETETASQPSTASAGGARAIGSPPTLSASSLLPFVLHPLARG